MRLVLDTNTAISALLWHGTPGKLIDAAQIKTVSLFTSAPLLAELRGVLLREKFAKQLKAKSVTPGEIADGYAVLASIVMPAVISSTIVHDPPMMQCSLLRSLQESISSSPATIACATLRTTKAFPSSRPPKR